MTERILVVAAHPDDEILGIGGTAARHADEGADVHVLIVAEGATSRNPDATEELHHLRQAAAAAAAILGTRPPRFAGLPDNRMDSLDLLDIVKRVEEVVDDVRPRLVYTHHGGDLNVDHVLTHRAVLTACRPLPGSTVDGIFTFETVSSTEWAPEAAAQFHPQHFVDVTDTLERKLEALRAYDMEMRPFPHARSLRAVDAVARARGASVGMEAAEAFGVVRTRCPKPSAMP